MNAIEVAKQTQWHTPSAAEAIERLGTDGLAGLAAPEAGRRPARFGPNRLRMEEKKLGIVRLLAQFNDFMVWVLLAAVLISGLWPKEYLDAAVGGEHPRGAEAALARLAGSVHHRGCPDRFHTKYSKS